MWTGAPAAAAFRVRGPCRRRPFNWGRERPCPPRRWRPDSWMSPSIQAYKQWKTARPRGCAEAEAPSSARSRDELIIRGRSPEPSPCDYAVSDLATTSALFRRAAPLCKPKHADAGKTTPPAVPCHSLDAARRSSGFGAGNAAAAFRTSSVSSVFKEPPHHGANHRPPTRLPPPAPPDA